MLLSQVSITVKNTSQKQLGRKGFISSSMLDGVHSQGKPRQELEADTQRSTAYRLAPVSYLSYIIQAHLSRPGTTPSEPGYPISITNLENTHGHSLPQASLMDRILSGGSLFPGVSASQLRLAITLFLQINPGPGILRSHPFESPRKLVRTF